MSVEQHTSPTLFTLTLYTLFFSNAETQRHRVFSLRLRVFAFNQFVLLYTIVLIMNNIPSYLLQEYSS